MKLCGWCGQENEDEAVNCCECGTVGFKVKEVTSPMPKEPFRQLSYNPDNIQVFFPAKYDNIAIRLARFLSQYLGEDISDLHGQMTFGEILKRSRDAACLFEPGFVWGWAEQTHRAKFDEQDTFRDIVETVYELEHT